VGGRKSSLQHFTSEHEQFFDHAPEFFESMAGLLQPTITKQMVFDAVVVRITEDIPIINLPSKVQLYHGVTLKRYRRMLQDGRFNRYLSQAPGDFCANSALYFSNCYKYALFWSTLKSAAYSTMKFDPLQLKGVVISVELGAMELAALDEDGTEVFIQKNLNGNGTTVDAAAIVGGFSSGHIAELSGGTVPHHPNARASLQSSSNASQYLDISSLLQVGFLYEEGEEVLMNSGFKVRYLIIMTEFTADHYPRWH
jgi:hypothetical protein